MPAPESILSLCLKRLLEQGETLSREDARELLDFIFEVDDFGSEIRVATILGALAARGETADELAGFVDAMRARAIPIPLEEHERAQLVDTCGTGGDLSGTFNISTAAALVAAAAGVSVAKHGNRAVTSRCGSADVLEALGIPVDLTPMQAAASLRAHRFAFLPAPALQPAMKAIMPIRRAIGVRTAFNILGPMTNPAGARAQVLGVYKPGLVPVVAHTLARLNTRHALVVHGSGMDEFSISGPTTVAQVQGDQVRFSTVLPEDFGLPLAPLEALRGGNAAGNAAMLLSIFRGENSPRRDVVVINAAAVLVVAALADSFLEGATLAQDAIDSGRASALVAALATPRILIGGLIMARVTGIGGVFLKARDPKALAAWYAKHLNLSVSDYGGINFLWSDEVPAKTGMTAWSLFPADSKYFGPGTQTAMINYRVDDLDGLLEQLCAAHVTIDPKRDDASYGRFAWIVDPEGNRIELWQPLVQSKAEAAEFLK